MNFFERRLEQELNKSPEEILEYLESEQEWFKKQCYNPFVLEFLCKVSQINVELTLSVNRIFALQAQEKDAFLDSFLKDLIVKDEY